MDAKLGATGEFPRGKILEDDEGELRLGVAVDKKSQTVIVDFGKLVKWIGLDKKSALNFCDFIRKRTEELD